MLLIEKIIIDFINSESPVNAYLQIPSSPPEKYIIVDKIGSKEKNFIHESSLALQSYAPTLQECAELSEALMELSSRLVELDEIIKVEIVRNYNFTNPEKKQHRYQTVIRVRHY